MSSGYNDLDLEGWRELDINTESLWLINERDKSGKHKNIYHGNFIPQIPNQLIRRYTKAGDTVFEPFMGSGTTAIECEKLGRNYIGFDINPEMISYVGDLKLKNNLVIKNTNSEDASSFDFLGDKKFQFALLHPPYWDIVKFTDKKEDLSNCTELKEFVDRFITICKNFMPYLEKNRYFAVVIGDVYKNSEVIPLGFYLMHHIKLNFKVKLKGIIVKNIEGNRGKIGQNNIWRYRALKNDYFIFKHEYILVFKKL